MNIRHYIARFFLKYAYNDWKFVGQFPTDVKKYVLIGAPHTSFHDFFIGLFTQWYFKVDFHFVAKASLFKFPMGFVFKAFGGIPVNRSKSQGMVGAVATLFKERESFILAISPEGTRKKVTEWKTGFYYIAKEANVPIVSMTFDFAKNQTEVCAPFYPTADIQTDMTHLKSVFKGVVGKKPEGSFEP